jgi:hypothetical protein
VSVELPTGDVSQQLGSGLTDVWLNTIAQKSLTERTTWRGNLGVLFAGNTATGAIGIKPRGTVLTGGTSLVRGFTPRLQLGVEVTGAITRAFALGRRQLQMLLGGNYEERPDARLWRRGRSLRGQPARRGNARPLG